MLFRRLVAAARRAPASALAIALAVAAALALALAWLLRARRSERFGSYRECKDVLCGGKGTCFECLRGGWKNVTAETASVQAKRMAEALRGTGAFTSYRACKDSMCGGRGACPQCKGGKWKAVNWTSKLTGSSTMTKERRASNAAALARSGLASRVAAPAQTSTAAPAPTAAPAQTSTTAPAPAACCPRDKPRVGDFWCHRKKKVAVLLSNASHIGGVPFGEAGIMQGMSPEQNRGISNRACNSAWPACGGECEASYVANEKVPGRPDACPATLPVC